MEKLIPYSIHLKPEIYSKIKEAAGERRASEVIRNAITMYLQNEESYMAGFNDGYNRASEEIRHHPVAQSIGWRGEQLSELLSNFLQKDEVKNG
jgi:predicted transcriptional regulator